MCSPLWSQVTSGLCFFQQQLWEIGDTPVWGSPHVAGWSTGAWELCHEEQRQVGLLRPSIISAEGQFQANGLALCSVLPLVQAQGRDWEQGYKTVTLHGTFYIHNGPWCPRLASFPDPTHLPIACSTVSRPSPNFPSLAVPSTASDGKVAEGLETRLVLDATTVGFMGSSHV